jgi:hypothetical protein
MLDAGVEYDRPVGEGRRWPIDPGRRGWRFSCLAFSFFCNAGRLLSAAGDGRKDGYQTNGEGPNASADFHR